MNDTKMKILKNIKDPIAIKDLQEKTGIQWGLLSIHLKDLEQKGLIMNVGKEGKSRVIQLNQFAVSKYFEAKEDELKETRQELM